MHPDDVKFVLENKKNNFVIGLQTAKDKPVLYINFIDPGSYDFHQALRDACTIALTSQTVTQAQADIIAYVYQKLQAQRIPATKMSVSINEHVVVSTEYASIPIIMLDEKFVYFYWHAVAYSTERIYLTNMRLQYVLANTAQHIGNIVHERITDHVDYIATNNDNEEEDYMHFHFFHKNK